MKEKLLNFFSKTYIFFILTIIYIPIILLLIFSFNESKTLGHWTGFSLKWYLSLLTNQELLTSVLLTILICLLSTIISLFIGFILSINIYFSKYYNNTNTNKKSNIFLSLNQFLISTPDIVLGVSYMILFLTLQIPFSWITILIAHIFFNVPVVIILIINNFSKIDQNLIFATKDLGSNKLQTINHAIIPPLKGTLISAALMCASFSLDDFIITYFTSGEGVSTLSVTIFTQIKRQITPEINALFSIIIFLVIIIAIFKYFKNNKRYI